MEQRAVPSGFDREIHRALSLLALSHLRYAGLLLAPGRPVRLRLLLLRGRLVVDVGDDVGDVGGRSVGPFMDRRGGDGGREGLGRRRRGRTLEERAALNLTDKVLGLRKARHRK